MKFVGTPNMSIRMTVSKGFERYSKFIGRFDQYGIFETEDKKIIQRMLKRFETTDVELKKCKKCNFSCTNTGELLAHYKNEHPKE